jgi:hypothetical protein
MKIKAYIKRWIHLMKYIIKLEFHCAVTFGTEYSFFGLAYYFKADKITCTCGKVFYEKKAPDH